MDVCLVGVLFAFT